MTNKLKEAIAAVAKLVGKHPHDRVEAIVALTKALVDCRETPGLVSEAMQPWVDATEWPEEDEDSEDEESEDD